MKREPKNTEINDNKNFDSGLQQNLSERVQQILIDEDEGTHQNAYAENAAPENRNTGNRQIENKNTRSISAKKQTKKKKKGARKVLIPLFVILGIIIAAVLAVGGLFMYMTSGMITASLEDADIAITSEDVDTDSDIFNVVVLGIDKEENRSDTMMICSLNKSTNTLRIVSILRDSRVHIDGCRYGTKIGFAYKWGGEELALRTINQTFGTNLNQFVTFQFENVISIIDTLGGIEMEITDDEAYQINDLMLSFDVECDDVTGGLQHLNGTQALCYSRIRKIDGEYNRANRQQKVMLAMFSKLKNASVFEMPSLIKSVLDDTKTTLGFKEIFPLVFTDVRNMTIERYTIPDSEYETDVWGGWEEVEGWEMNDGFNIDQTQWVWIYDLDAAAARLHSIIDN